MNQPTPSSSAPAGKNSATLGAVAVLILAAIIGGVAYTRKPAVTNAPVNPEPAAKPSHDAGMAMKSFTSYKDGTFTAQGHYDTHAGPEEITITLTLKDGIVTDSQFQGTPAARMSQRFMDMFANNYKPMVIGKKINELHLDKISGSSLTPIGFNNALEKIKQEAGQL